jgi:hypothetical protein
MLITYRGFTIWADWVQNASDDVLEGPNVNIEFEVFIYAGVGSDSMNELLHTMKVTSPITLYGLFYRPANWIDTYLSDRSESDGC